LPDQNDQSANELFARWVEGACADESLFQRFWKKAFNGACISARTALCERRDAEDIAIEAMTRLTKKALSGYVVIGPGGSGAELFGGGPRRSSLLAAGPETAGDAFFCESTLRHNINSIDLTLLTATLAAKNRLLYGLRLNL
jgi:hypothetical protein